MKTFQLFLICASLVLQNVQGNEADVLTKRDNSVEVDPYAAYYEQYAAQHQDEPNFVAAYADEKQGFGASMQNILGPDAGVMLGLIGAVLGTIAVVGVAVNNNNVNSLSKDQDSICTTAKSFGDFTYTKAATDATLPELTVAMTALAAFATPSC